MSCLGVFGLTWEEKVLANMRTRLAADYARYGMYINSSALKNLRLWYLEAMKDGVKPFDFSVDPGMTGFGARTPETNALINRIAARSSIPTAVVLAYAAAMFYLHSIGSVPWREFDPVSFGRAEEARSDLPGQFSWDDFWRGTFRGFSDTAKLGAAAVVAVAVVVGLIYLKPRRV